MAEKSERKISVLGECIPPIGDYQVGLDWKEYTSKVPHKNGRIWFTPNRFRDAYSDQYVGKNTIGPYASEIAEFLGK